MRLEALPSPGDEGRRRRPRRPTSTASFGSGRRESHDASGFYERFVGPEVSDDDTVATTPVTDVVHCGDARHMDQVTTGSVALVVTSPPYFAGKEYEQSLGCDGVPATYFEYLGLLTDVFAECRRVLEPGGRIAVNVANLGRRPFRSLAGDVTQILSDLGLLLRGEIVWWKGRAAGGSCAWGTFQSPGNPVLRDVTERVVIASKGRFDRALKPEARQRLGLPSTATITRDEFLEATTDLWEIPPESASRVGHPAPFPVPLVQRLVELYTYERDVVLDPFLGSGTTAVAAVRTGRRYLGFDTDPGYVRLAEGRIAAERVRGLPAQIALPVGACESETEDPDPVEAAIGEGRQAKEVARLLLAAAGWRDVRADMRAAKLGLVLDFVATDASGREWVFDVSGGFTSGTTSGLRRADALWRLLGTASVLHEDDPARPYVALTTAAPTPRGAGDRALAAVRGPGRPVLDVIELTSAADRTRLAGYAERGRPD